MDFLAEKQKTKIFSSSGIDDIELNCYIKNISNNTINLAISPVQLETFEEVEEDFELSVKVYTSNGIVIFESEVLKIISNREILISFDRNVTKIEDTRKNPRYKSSLPITIFRPLQSNIEGHLIDISVRGLKFYSPVSLDENSKFEIMLNLSNAIGKIIIIGKVLNKDGLPEGIHRMVIEEISYTDRQKLVDYCMSLAN